MYDFSSIQRETLQCITAQQAWHYAIIPFYVNKEACKFYIDAQRFGNGVEEELEILLGKTIHLEPVESEGLKRGLGELYRKNEQRNERATKATVSSQSKDFLLDLIHESQSLGSSDIHLEAYENVCRIRFRIDGELMERYVLTKLEYPSLVNKIKIKANLDIAEKRLPQDGRIFFKEKNGRKTDIRVSVLPTLYGEKIVMRLLSKDGEGIVLSDLGFGTEELEIYKRGIHRPNGIVLISGPTGSGKTTTLYATLKLLNEKSKNILTIEDPIEYTLEGVNQVQLKESIGLDFASVLRTFLRQDPDIIMVGEIRDKDTASMAIRASLTGHLVLSTVHTNSAWGIISRLVDMGVPSYLLADTMNLAVAQRLLRKLCPSCKEEIELDIKTLPPNFKPPSQLGNWYGPVGCEACYYSGYKGRKAVYEIIPIDQELADKIKAKEFNILDLLKERGIRSLADNAFELLNKGVTSVKEVYPILSSR